MGFRSIQFFRDPLDRYYASDVVVNKFQQALNCLDLSGLSILEFGIGNGALTLLFASMPVNQRPKKIIGFEIDYLPKHTILNLTKTLFNGGIEFILNPKKYEISAENIKGDIIGYNYFNMLTEENFAIIGNPPYYLWNHVLSISGTGYIIDSNKDKLEMLGNRCKGVMGLTNIKRLHNHLGWLVSETLGGDLFNPTAFEPDGKLSQNIIVLTGFQNRIDTRINNLFQLNKLEGCSQLRPHINSKKRRRNIPVVTQIKSKL